MKTVAKILITVTGLLLALVIVSVTILRKELQVVVDNYNLEHPYKKLEVPYFDGLVVNGNWDLFISQDREPLVEAQGERLRDFFEFDDGVLKLSNNDSLTAGDIPWKLRIKMPGIKALKLEGKAKAEVYGFTQDSLVVHLSGETVFISSNNKLEEMPITTEGNAKVRFRDKGM